MRIQSLFYSLIMLLFFSASVNAKKVITFGIVMDGRANQLSWSAELFKAELRVLTKNDFTLRFPADKELNGDWSAKHIAKAHKLLQEDTEVDMVLALGYISSAVVALEKSLDKPTFAPFIMDANFQGLPQSGNTSGVKNLNYLSSGADFQRDLRVMNEVADCKKVAVFIEEASFAVQPKLIRRARDISAASAIELEFIQQRAHNENIAMRLSPEIDCVVVTGQGRLSTETMSKIIATLIEKKIPSYSLLDARLVERGLLMGEASASYWRRLARRNALNVHEVMHGELAEEQPITFESKRRLTINMATARAIGISPRFNILTSATLINEAPSAQGRILSLATVAEEAIRANLDLRAASLGLKADKKNIDRARAKLRPQINARLGYSQFDSGSAAVVSGVTAERVSNATVTLSQLIYSDAARANVDVEQYRQRNREALKRQLELDIIGEATTTYLNVLKAQTLVNIRREDLKLNRANLEIAQDRQRIGVASPAEVYRWQSRLATSHRALLDARAQLDKVRDNLNRLLHRPLTEPFITEPATLEDPRLLVSRKELFDYVNSDRAFKLMGEFMVKQGVEASPELAGLTALLAVTKRQLKTNRRAYWSPTISIEGEFNHIVDEERRVGLSAMNDTDWAVRLNISLPIFEGGSRRARVSGSRLSLSQLLTAKDATRERVEQRIRTTLHDIGASYPSIQLSRDAASAAKKNRDLVTKAYSQGTISILELLDAQNAALIAEERATNAVFDFLIDLMNLQRNLGQIDFFLTQQELNSWIERLRIFISTAK